MLITIEKTTTVSESREVKFPCFFKYKDNWFYMFRSEDAGLEVCTAKSIKVSRVGEILNPKSSIKDCLSGDYTPITQAEFARALHTATLTFESYFPETFKAELNAISY
jgi:hypothetical protein